MNKIIDRQAWADTTPVVFNQEYGKEADSDVIVIIAELGAAINKVVPKRVPVSNTVDGLYL